MALVTESNSFEMANVSAPLYTANVALFHSELVPSFLVASISEATAILVTRALVMVCNTLVTVLRILLVLI